uniref:Uncharacterized protein n=1 Tax=Tanacetum cinerariifolium TaxID=118510 RepID=A0A699GSB6_TANCI|nr:hypothetical protein [Tanacetum cinerariifolium]
MAQQIILAAQLVPKFQGIGRCNNYAILQSIPCSPKYKIVEQIFLDHSLSYALTATDNLFTIPATIEIIQSFIQRVGYQGVVEKKQVVKREKDVRSYVDKFDASMIHDDVNDSGDRIEPRIHKEHSKVVVDDDDNKEEKKDEKEGDEMGSLEIRTKKMDDEFHSQRHDDHHEDDAPPEGEKRRVPTIFDRARMEATLNDMLGNQFRNAKEYANHLKQATNFMENQIVRESRKEDIRRLVPRPLVFYGPQWNLDEPPMYLYNKDPFFLKNGNTEEKKYILSLHKIKAERFTEADLEEKINRWVRKEFKNFNEDARLSIQHWKDSWHKSVCKQNQRKVRDN